MSGFAGVIGGLLEGGAAAGIDAIKTQEATDLQLARDRSLRAWQERSAEMQAERQEASDERKATREDARWTKDREINEARDAARQKQHEEAQETARRGQDFKDTASQRQYDAMMSKIDANGESKDGSASAKELKTALELAKEFRENGNTKQANAVLEAVYAKIRGVGSQALPPPKPGAGASGGKPGSEAALRSVAAGPMGTTLEKLDAELAEIDREAGSVVDPQGKTDLAAYRADLVKTREGIASAGPSAAPAAPAVAPPPPSERTGRTSPAAAPARTADAPTQQVVSERFMDQRAERGARESMAEQKRARDAQQRAEFLLESGDIDALARFQSSRDFNVLDQKTKAEIHRRVNGIR